MMEKFFKTLFEYIDGQYILIWLYNGDKRKESYWFTDYKSASSFVESRKSELVNIYCGVGLSPKDFGRDNRCLKKNIIGIPALWIDIDVYGPNHKKPNLPQTMDDARKLFNAIEHSPTMIISSGGGLQAWWVFNEPWIFDADTERQDAENLAKRFIYRFKQEAQQYGWDVDSVYNLDRVLRVPGTYNRKGEPVLVELIECNDFRYNPSDFDEVLPTIDDVKDYSYQAGSDFILDSTAQPPFQKFEVLREVESKFWLSWNHQRKDLQDQSASAYDLALANYAAMAGWTDQEIANLLIAHRAKHGEDLKLRQDYYKRTIAIAKKNTEKYKAEEEIMQMAALEPDEPVNITDEHREAIIQNLSAMFNVKITNIMKYMSDPPTYKLITPVGSIHLGDVENLIQQGKLRNKLAALTGKYLPHYDTKKWSSIAQQLLNACIEQELGEEATEEGLTEQWLSQYLSEKTIFDDPNQALANFDPFRSDDALYIFGQNFKQWIRVVQMEKVSTKQLGVMLRGVGALPDKRNFKTEEGSYVNRSVWKLKAGDAT
ncbi:MAG: hypothetical protein GXY18_03710 [Methanomicrobiales archaeon]|nr:hypothetical protein [Methanomicrobiales archaeon]